MTLQQLADKIIQAARDSQFEEAVTLMKELPHDKFTWMTISSVQKKLERFQSEKMSRKEQRDLRREIQEEILAEMGIKEG